MLERTALAVVLLALVCACELLATAREDSGPEEWLGGPRLMLDARNVLSVEHMQRVLGRPKRYGAPIVDGATDGNFQPYVSVVRDAQSGRWRIWYGIPRTPGNTIESNLATMESNDGIHWKRPRRVLETAPIQFGASVIDEGPAFPEPRRRFKAAWYKNDGLQVSTSPDGLNWTELAPGPLLRHNHDINAIAWDPIRRRYIAFVSIVKKLDPSWPSERRIPHMSTSDDLIHWRPPWEIIRPDPESPREQGETQFYCMSGVIARGDLLIGLARVLRDDLNSEPGLSAQDLGDSRAFAGIGYTVLAWSSDGERWHRDTEPFLGRNPKPGTWDRAHAWGDAQVVYGDDVYIYYGGYKLGHKAERFTTRQIGLATLKVDRYAGYRSDADRAGVVRTPVRTWRGRSLSVNAEVSGDLRVGLCEPSGRFYPGFAFSECEPTRGDGVALPARWRDADPASLDGKPVQIVFRVTGGAVFAFTIGR